jgi:hypothetical protein
LIGKEGSAQKKRAILRNVKICRDCGTKSA